MQVDGAYVDQIPAGAKAPPQSPPAIRIGPGAASGKARSTPPGLYVQVVDAASQEEALQASLAFAQRLGPERPPFMRGEVVTIDGRLRIAMYAGPFTDDSAARRFCGVASPERACLIRAFEARSGDRAPKAPKGAAGGGRPRGNT